ncbi:hypothetical protein HAD_15992 [Hyphomonas adhaerens MHS-3]|uniref:Lipoprotein n=1 Tax=Hyphomonas adhaerens MHS-3 TaxID=1280949 RepID=A0A069E180_9PROT|nr:hypothetical protein [Hyphomonas adhaerens]KCZ83204.1 hypothetical protein HAD_15992 [Hyphomonas adhaerens MHS-3]
MPRASVLAILVSIFLAACSGGQGASRQVSPDDVRSADFALLPCAASSEDAPCLLVVAGGKRVLFGTPSGLRKSMPGDTLASLDAVLLFSLQGPDLEGLDEVRNAGWTAGREGPLAVGGPSGTREVIAALNKAYELSDAQIFVETSPKGGFGAALLGVLPGEGDAKTDVFNTGDLVVTKIEASDGRAGYWVDYGGERAVLQPCGMTLAVKFNELDAFTLACGEEAPNAWPLQDVQYLVQGASAAP